MPKPFNVQFDRFSNGLTSELRLNLDNPKYARIWNFKQTPDRLIQQMGFEQRDNNPAHIVEFWLSNSTNNEEQFHKKRPTFVGIEENLNARFYSAECNGGTAQIDLGPGSLAMGNEPIYFAKHFVYLRDDGTVQAFQIEPDPLLAGNPQTQQLFAGENFISDSGEPTAYFTNMGTYLIVYGPRSVHIWDPYGLYGAVSPSNGDATELTQWSRQGDSDGNVSSYVPDPPLLPQGLVLDEVKDLQRRLTELGYTVAETGFFGPETEAAVIALQNDSVVPEGGPPSWGTPGNTFASEGLVTGIVGPLTLLVLNNRKSRPGSAANEFRNVITTNGEITAESQYGDYVAFATQERDGNAHVFIWNGLILNNGFAGENLLTDVQVGQGSVQILSVIDGSLMSIMSPASEARCTSHYTSLNIYRINSHLDSLPPSQALLVAEYHLKQDVGPGGNNSLNYINRKSQLLGGKLYFSGRLHLQRVEDSENDEGAMSGVFSINKDGNLYFEVARPASNDIFPDENIISFGVVDSGYAISSDNAVFLTDESEDSKAGFITSIINAGHPYLNKSIDNIYLHVHNTQDVNEIEIWLREIEDIYDNDAGWQLAYRSTDSSPVNEPTTENKFKNRIAINRLESNERFAQFRELQLMVIVDGKCAEIPGLYMTGYINDINE